MRGNVLHNNTEAKQGEPARYWEQIAWDGTRLYNTALTSCATS